MAHLGASEAAQQAYANTVQEEIEPEKIAEAFEQDTNLIKAELDDGRDRLLYSIAKCPCESSSCHSKSWKRELLELPKRGQGQGQFSVSFG